MSTHPSSVLLLFYAPLVKLVDTLDLGSSASAVRVRVSHGAHIYIIMAYYNVKTDNETEFLAMLSSREESLVTAMVEGVLDAIDNGLELVELISVKLNKRKVNKPFYTISIKKEEYRTLLKNCLDDMVRFEKYELCAKMKSYLDRLEQDL